MFFFYNLAFDEATAPSRRGEAWQANIKGFLAS